MVGENQKWTGGAKKWGKGEGQRNGKRGEQRIWKEGGENKWKKEKGGDRTVNKNNERVEQFRLWRFRIWKKGLKGQMSQKEKSETSGLAQSM